MNYYYAAAALVTQGLRRSQARRPALAALLLDPWYKTRLKAGVALHAWGGERIFNLLRRLRPRRPPNRHPPVPAEAAPPAPTVRKAASPPAPAAPAPPDGGYGFARCWFSDCLTAKRKE
jgi:hypothetical protein